MLLQYVVSNYKSIGHPVEFSMFPVQETMDERFLKSIPTKNGTWKVLRRGGFLGPNASGKSSFIKSIAFARDFIVDGQKSGKGIKIDQFRGKIDELKDLSTFQFVFYLNEEVYEYGFALDRFQVHEEWLMQLTGSGFVSLFTRTTDKQGKTEIDIESRFARKNSKERMLAEVLKASIQENDIDEESDGTQRLLDLLPMLFAMREDSHAIYFVDEIDRSLHTKLSQYLLSEFIHNCESTFNQIIFTAHDVNLININDFRQEEIWFIEKNNLGESRLRPLSDFRLQKGQDALKAYLSGRFGAIPMIRREF